MAVNNTDSTTVKLATIGSLGAAVVLVLLPFHAVFTTWLGSNFQHLDAFRIWKELLILILAVVAVAVVVRAKSLRQFITKDILIILIVAYTVLEILLAAVALRRHNVSASALIYGLLANLRFLGFFAVVLAFARYSDWLRQHWPKLVLGPALIVIAFGLLQLVLPNNFLSHLGYGPSTIPAFHVIDQKNAYIRLQSTLRGPNPLGAYLVLVLAITTAGFMKFKKARMNLGLLTATGLAVLYFTYSRSAALGLLVSLFIILLLSIKSPKLRWYLCGAAAVMVIVGAGVVWSARNNDQIQNTVFHTDETSLSPESSNQARSQALKDGLKDIKHNPWGSGPGTAGPASTRNDYGARIAENYYLQIGQEVGIIGMIMFIAINIVAAMRLYARRSSVLALGLLASLVGITFVNMLSHAWADDTLALLWWGLAAIALAQPVILNKKRKHFNVQTQEKAAP